MYASSTFFIAILALVREAFATPPACLIAAMGAQVNPGDLKALCGTLESSVVGNITELCTSGSNAYSSAASIYAATCLSSESVTISITASSSSVKSSSTSDSAKTTGTSTGSAVTTATGTVAKATGSTTGTATAASSTSTKANSASSSSPTHFFLAAVAIGVAGFLL